GREVRDPEGRQLVVGVDALTTPGGERVRDDRCVGERDDRYRDGGREEAEDVRDRDRRDAERRQSAGNLADDRDGPRESRHGDDDTGDRDCDERTRDGPREPSDEQDRDEATEAQRERGRYDLPL